MLTAILVTLLIAAGLRYGIRGGGRSETIARHPYNNRYNDASGARDDSF